MSVEKKSKKRDPQALAEVAKAATEADLPEVIVILGVEMATVGPEPIQEELLEDSAIVDRAPLNAIED
jgi:hypothetical protein